ncbi:hypothetical protein [Streptomyces sp. NPDC007905]|uniref:hypothetical protein n=1 Tax=Streptomyces sp. NPDC007905 TaxID=3364788 RepID=UPI0036EE19B3
MKTDQTRAVSAIRLSVETDETTSPGRQRAANESAAASIGAEIIGEAVDLGVSASKTDTHSAADVVFPPGSAPVRRGTYRQRGTLIDLTHYGADGKPLMPPAIPLDVLRPDVG